MDSLDKFCVKEGVKLSEQQMALVIAIIQKVNQLGMRVNRSGKTYALQLADEYLTEVLPNHEER